MCIRDSNETMIQLFFKFLNKVHKSAVVVSGALDDKTGYFLDLYFFFTFCCHGRSQLMMAEILRPFWGRSVEIFFSSVGLVFF